MRRCTGLSRPHCSGNNIMTYATAAVIGYPSSQWTSTSVNITFTQCWRGMALTMAYWTELTATVRNVPTDNADVTCTHGCRQRPSQIGEQRACSGVAELHHISLTTAIQSLHGAHTRHRALTPLVPSVDTHDSTK